MEIKSGLLYTKNDEWIMVKGEIGYVGITDYAQEKMTDIVYVEAVEVGKEVKKGDVIATIESVKAAAEIYAPISGKISKVNDKLSESPELINQDPYGEGWIVAIEIADPTELKELMSAEAYQEYIKDRG